MIRLTKGVLALSLAFLATTGLAWAEPSTQSTGPEKGPGRQELFTDRTQLGFGAVQVGQESATQLFEVVNGSVRTLSPVSFQHWGLHGSDFPIVSHSCPDALESLESCYVTLRFTPSGEGARESTLMITAGDRHASVDLSGRGLTAAPLRQAAGGGKAGATNARPRVKKLVPKVLRLPANGRIKVLRLACPQAACRVTQANARLRFAGQTRKLKLRVDQRLGQGDRAEAIVVLWSALVKAIQLRRADTNVQVVLRVRSAGSSRATRTAFRFSLKP